MENKCCDCEHLNRNDEKKDWLNGKITYRCKECWDYKKLDDKACYKFKELRKNTGGYTPTGCYITTIVCDILGYEDNCEVLQTLRNFRDSYLKTKPEYLNILIEYDQVGPLISEGLKNEKRNKMFAAGLLKYFLIPCVESIKRGHFEEAIEIYQNMVIYLNDEFNLPTINVNDTYSYDLKNLGKGRLRTKPSEC